MQQSASESGCEDMLWCSSTDREDSDSETESEDDDDMKEAYVARRYIWKNRKELLVQFHNQVPPVWLYKGEPIDGTLIMTWANVWNDMCIQCMYFGDNQESLGMIPKFVEASSAVARHYDILVHFNSDGKNHSEIGVNAQNKPVNEPTMYLDLSNGDDVYRKHLVIHEFGHALGLLHEHQRSDFWKHIKPHIDITKMKEMFTPRAFKRDWGRDKSRNAVVSDYDPDSIMHYWFVKEWLQGYTSKDQIDEDLKAGKLTKGEACVLLGVFKRDGNVATEPSKLDIEFLMKEYGIKVK